MVLFWRFDLLLFDGGFEILSLDSLGLLVYLFNDCLGIGVLFGVVLVFLIWDCLFLDWGVMLWLINGVSGLVVFFLLFDIEVIVGVWIGGVCCFKGVMGCERVVLEVILGVRGGCNGFVVSWGCCGWLLLLFIGGILVDLVEDSEEVVVEI